MNGLKFIRTRCNISLSELADVLDISRQQISAWENDIKPISKKRLEQLSAYFGIEEKYFLKISEEDKEYVISQALYLRQDGGKDKFSFVKPGEMTENFTFHPYRFPDFESSLDEQLADAKKKKQDTLDGIEFAMTSFGRAKALIDQISAIRRACDAYDSLTEYLSKTAEQPVLMRSHYYCIGMYVQYALLRSTGQMTEQELDDRFKIYIDNELFDDRKWINELAENIRTHYEEKEKIFKKITEENKQALKTDNK